jgi:AcrR family transcriptional regulator
MGMTARRRRRTAGETRRAILDAARQRLAEGGPEAIRLQEIARDVGISHPAVLHHFGSRDGLTQALAQDAMDRLSAAVLEALPGADDDIPVQELFERVFAAWGDSGHARLLAWRGLQLEAPLAEHSEQAMIKTLCDAIHTHRVEYARASDLPAPSREESAFLVRLVALALLGDAIVGPIFNYRARSDKQRDPQRRFRAWLAALLTDHIMRGGAVQAGGAKGRGREKSPHRRRPTSR